MNGYDGVGEVVPWNGALLNDGHQAFARRAGPAAPTINTMVVATVLQSKNISE